MLYDEGNTIRFKLDHDSPWTVSFIDRDSGRTWSEPVVGWAVVGFYVDHKEISTMVQPMVAGRWALQNMYEYCKPLGDAVDFTLERTDRPHPIAQPGGAA